MFLGSTSTHGLEPWVYDFGPPNCLDGYPIFCLLAICSFAGEFNGLEPQCIFQLVIGFPNGVGRYDLWASYETSNFSVWKVIVT